MLSIWLNFEHTLAQLCYWANFHCCYCPNIEQISGHTAEGVRSFNVILVVIFAKKCENGISTILVFAQNRMEYVTRRDVTYGRDAT